MRRLSLPLARFTVALPGIALLAALATVTPAPARADLLVTREGALIETQGPWRVQGRQVIFTLPNGMLSALRVDAVDLDQSALATARAAEPRAAAGAAGAAASAGEPMIRLTEADFTPVEEEAAEGTEAAEGEGTAKGQAAKTSGPLEVVSWDKVGMPNGDGVQVFGTVKNTSRTHVTDPSVILVLYGEEGGMLATTDAALNRTNVPPGESINFRAEFPGLPDFASIKFELQSRGFETRDDSAAEGEEESVEAPPAEIGDEGGDSTLESESAGDEAEAESEEPPPAGDGA